jgi:predicted transcriptional regulator
MRQERALLVSACIFLIILFMVMVWSVIMQSKRILSSGFIDQGEVTIDREICLYRPWRGPSLRIIRLFQS